MARSSLLLMAILFTTAFVSAQERVNDSTTYSKGKNKAPVVTKTVGEGSGEVVDLTNDGLDLAEKGKYKQALVKLYKALEYEPTNVELLSNVGSIENLHGNSVKGEEYLERAWEASGRTNLDVAVNLGLACYHNKKYAKSVGFFTQVVSGSKDPTTVGAAYFNRCMAYAKSGKCEEAEKDYQSVKELYKEIKSAKSSLNQLKGMVARCQ